MVARADPSETDEFTASQDAGAYRHPPSFTAQAAGHRLTLYPSGADRLQALLRMIAEARESLRIVFYIFARDTSGTRVRDALVEAARRGVAVKIMVDGFGAEADAAFFAPLTEAGGRFWCFLPKLTRRYLIRNHQKIVLADERAAMIGGFNVEDSYFAPPDEDGWNDLAVHVTGPAVERIGAWLDELEDWVSRRDAQFRAIRRKVADWRPGAPPVQVLIGGPTGGLSSWARCVERDLAEGERLDMIMAYFSPPPRLGRRIQRIARRGKTRLIMAAKSDNGATVGASRSLYGKLLEAGAQVYEFQPCKLHTKLIVLDDAVYLGSANFDMRSLYINLEIVLRIEDAVFAERMRGFIEQHLPASEEVTPDVYRRWAGPFARLRWWASWFLVAVVDYTVTHRLNLRP
jgi:cardiolipin synthase